MPSVGSSLAIVTAAASTCFVPDLRWALIAGLKSLFFLFVVSQLVAKPEPPDSECPKEEIVITPKSEKVEEKVTDDCEEIGLAVADVHPRTDRPRRRATRGLCRDDSRLLGDVALVLPSSTGEEKATPNPRHPQAEGLIPGRRLVVNFHGITRDSSSGQSMRALGSF